MNDPMVKNTTLSFSLAGGGIAWLLHLLLCYLVAEFGCLTGLRTVVFWEITAVAWLLILVTLLTLAMAAAASVVSWQNGKKLRLAAGENETGAKSFTARAGLVTNGLFIFIILVQSIPIFYYLRDC